MTAIGVKMPTIVLALSRKGDHVVKHANGTAMVTLNKPPDVLDEVEAGAIVVQVKGSGSEHLIGVAEGTFRIASDVLEVKTLPILPAIGPLQYDLYSNGSFSKENRWLMRMYLFDLKQAYFMHKCWNVKNGVIKSNVVPLYKPTLIQERAVTRAACPADVPEQFMCPITMNWFEDPVITPYGHSYSRAAILSALSSYNMCPMTRLPLHKEDLVSNLSLRDATEYVRGARMQ